MAFEKYIIINDGAGTAKKFKTTHRTWKPTPEVPSTARQLLSGDLDVTFAAAGLMKWEGEIAAPVTADPTITDAGTIADLRTLLKKKQTFTVTDHYGNQYTRAHIRGPFMERSLTPDWTSSENVIYVTVQIMAKAL